MSGAVVLDHERGVWGILPTHQVRLAVWKWCSTSFLWFQVLKMWLGAFTLVPSPGRYPSAQLHGILFGLTHLSRQRHWWGKVNLLGQVFLQVIAVERRPPNPSPWEAGTRRGWQRPWCPVFPGILHWDFTGVILDLPLVPKLGFRPAPQPLACCHRASPRHLLPLPQLSRVEMKAPPASFAWSFQGVEAGWGCSAHSNGNLVGRSEKGQHPPCDDHNHKTYVWGGCPESSKRRLGNSPN